MDMKYKFIKMKMKMKMSKAKTLKRPMTLKKIIRIKRN